MSKVSIIASTSAPAPDPAANLDWDFFQVCAIQSIEEPDKKLKSQTHIPHKYQNLISQFPSLTKPDFRNVKHSVEHSIDTGSSAPVRCKPRPLLPGSPKAIAGKAAWDNMESLGIIEKVNANDSQYYSSPLHLQDKPDGSQRPCGDFRLLNEVTLQGREESGRHPSGIIGCPPLV